MVSVKFPVLPGVFDEARVVEIVSCVAGVVSAAVVSSMSASIFPLYTPVFKIIRYDTIRDAILTCARKPT